MAEETNIAEITPEEGAEVAEVSAVTETAEEEAADIAEDKNSRNLRKERIGIVVSNKMQKTIVVAVVDNVRHEKYGKIMKTTYKLKAHDENNECDIGDRVRVMETRPLSRDKRWRLVEIIEKVK